MANGVSPGERLLARCLFTLNHARVEHVTTNTTDLESIIDSRPISRFQYMLMAICALVAMMDGFDTQAIAFVASEIAIEWHVPSSAFGPVFGIGLLGSLVGAMTFGPAGDRFGRKPALVLAILIFSAGSLLTPLSSSINDLIGIRFITGLGLGGALPCFISLTSEYSPRRLRSTLVALMFCGFPLGAVIGGLASAKLIPAFGWASVFIAGGLLPLLVLPLLIFFVPESVRFLALKGARAKIIRVLGRMGAVEDWDGTFPVATAEVRAPISSLFREGRALGTVLLWSTLFFSLLLTYLLINWMPIIARRSGLGVEAAVTAVAMLNLGAVVGCLLIGRLADKFSPAAVIGAGYILGAAMIALMGYAGHSSVLLCAVAFVAGALSLGAQMCTVALCASFYETFLRATGVGWGMGIGRGGAIVGPVFGGLLLASGVDASTLFVVAGLTSLLSGATVLAMGVFVPRMRAQQDASRPFKPRRA